MNILEVNSLEKSFGSKEVLKGISFCVSENSVFGFIGRNGAGKTTTIKAILGLLSPDKGEISVCGKRVRYGNTPTNRCIGYLPDVPEFYGFMTANEYLTLCGGITGIPQKELKGRCNELLKLCKSFKRFFSNILIILSRLIGLFVFAAARTCHNYYHPNKKYSENSLFHEQIITQKKILVKRLTKL
jgi:ABC-type uncharacterized transport system ATPase subunit